MARRQGLPAPTQQRKGKKRSRTCFFDLPGELRNRIYRLVLLRKTDVYLAIKTKKLISPGIGHEDYSIKALQVGAGMPPILYASERLNAECRRIYFEENYFTFQDSSLCNRGIEAFRKFLDRSINNIWRLGVHRRFYIGDLKTPFEVHFVAVIEKNRILLCRPQNKNQPFPGIRSKMRGTYVEPCRCQVKRLAYDCHTGKRTNGLDLFDFIEKYVALIRSTAVNEYITICQKCDSVMRTGCKRAEQPQQQRPAGSTQSDDTCALRNLQQDITANLDNLGTCACTHFAPFPHHRPDERKDE